MKDLAKRVIVSLISICVITCLIVFSDVSWFQYIVAIMVAALTGIAIWEYGQFVKAKGGRVLLPICLAWSVIQVFAFFFAAIEFRNVFWKIPLFVFFIGFIVLIACHFKQKEGAIINLAVSSYGILYIAIPMGMILGILFGGEGGRDGRWWLAYLLIVTKIADMGAYFGGNLWGKRKLASIISPNKTLEGAIMGLGCSVFASFIFYLIPQIWTGVSFHLKMADAIFLGGLLGIVGQFGDLTESLLKRDANIKDSNDLPGLGGILDMIDSLLFNAFIMFFYLNYYNIL